MTSPPHITCTASAARCLGAWPYAETPQGMRPADGEAYRNRAMERLAHTGLMPILAEDVGTVWAMPFHKDAWRSGSRT